MGDNTQVTANHATLNALAGTAQELHIDAQGWIGQLPSSDDIKFGQEFPQLAGAYDWPGASAFAGSVQSLHAKFVTNYDGPGASTRTNLQTLAEQMLLMHGAVTTISDTYRTAQSLEHTSVADIQNAFAKSAQALQTQTAPPK